jgi:hypothetical protein
MYWANSRGQRKKPALDLNSWEKSHSTVRLKNNVSLLSLFSQKSDQTLQFDERSSRDCLARVGLLAYTWEHITS